MMASHDSPAMSVILVTPDTYDTIGRTVQHLKAQTVIDQIEVIIVAPSVEKLNLDGRQLNGFFKHHVIETGRIKSMAQSYAAGIRKAGAPVVAFVEEHSFPDKRWAEALIKAHSQPWAAVGPVMLNFNPDSMVSWSDFLLAYGPWMNSSPRGIVDHLPGHNSSYKRSVLMDYGEELEAMLEAESILHWDLRNKGYKLYLEPEAQTSHMNFELLSSFICAHFHNGRIFAAARSRLWPCLHRLLYTVCSPVIPIIRIKQILRYARRSTMSRKVLPNVMPALILGLIASASGEMTGYAAGAGVSRQKMTNFEFYRTRHLKKTNAI